MSGFFTRIVRQANASSQMRLRSALQLPFAELPSETHSAYLSEASDPSTARPQQIENQDETTQDARLSAPADRNEVTSHPSLAAENASLSAPPVSKHKPSQDAAAARENQSQTLVNSETTETNPALKGREQPLDAEQPVTRDLSAEETETQLEDGLETRHGHGLQPEPPARRSSTSPSLHSQGFDALPVPLVSGGFSETPADVDRQGNQTAMSPPPPLTQPPQPTQEPEVHVHIGRIEVTSVADPAPSVPQRPRRRAPRLSLEEHLAKRGGASP